jgi:hypothetical protein
MITAVNGFTCGISQNNAKADIHQSQNMLHFTDVPGGLLQQMLPVVIVRSKLLEIIV